MKKDKKTNFGFSIVDKNQKSSMVADVFHSVAKKYDVMNDLMSLGLHHIWKSCAVRYSDVFTGQHVLDVASGTGDITAKLFRLVGDTGKIVVVDINTSMIKVGREKLCNRGIIGNVFYVQANAEALPFRDNTFDCVIISFGLRNVTEKKKHCGPCIVF